MLKFYFAGIISVHSTHQCCGSRMFIPDPGSEFFPSRIPDPHQEFKYFNPKKWFSKVSEIRLVVHPGSGSRIRILTFYPPWIPDQGVKKAPDPGSGSATLFPNKHIKGIKFPRIKFLKLNKERRIQSRSRILIHTSD